MEDTEDKNWATRYLLDPLNAPDPSAETGPGTSFRPDPVPKTDQASKLPSPPTSPRRLSRNPFRKNSISSSFREPGMISSIGRSTSLSDKKASPVTATTTELPNRSASHRTVHSRHTSANYPTPPHRNSPAHRQEAFAEYSSRSNDNNNSPTNANSSNPDSTATTRRRRGSSLNERFPGDKSHQPLALLSREKHVADKSAHMTRKHHIQPDQIDALDTLGPDGKAYHHAGPYDATLYARNNTPLRSPLHALKDSNAEALKATPRDKLQDSIRGHRPLDGVATFPPGYTDRDGQTYNYTEGENMMIGSGPGDRPEGGAYKRWPGVDYHVDDIKGKSEPSYTIEKSLRDMDDKRRQSGSTAGEATDGSYEMSSAANRGHSGRFRRQRGSSGVGANGQNGGGMGNGMESPRVVSSSSVDATGADSAGHGGKRLSGGLTRRIGSIKKSFASSGAEA